MYCQTLTTAFGCLLHDFVLLRNRSAHTANDDKRSGTLSSQPVLPDIPVLSGMKDYRKWMSARSVKANEPTESSTAYIIRFADMLSSDSVSKAAAFAGMESNISCRQPLRSVFSHMNGEHADIVSSSAPFDGILRMPCHASEESVSEKRYSDSCQAICTLLSELSSAEDAAVLPKLLSVLESQTSTLPFSTIYKNGTDLSFYDHAKITAAIGCCVQLYSDANGISDYRDALFAQESSFLEREAFLLYSADLSGIQKFIYHIADRKALRSLRSRSFFLSLLMEHYADEILSSCGLCRANLLYSGGGHCYLLLPNTDSVIQAVEKRNRQFNDFLIDAFGTSLFIAHGYTACSGNMLRNVPAEKTPYKSLFRRVSSRIAAHKLHRYSAEQLIRMNSDGECGERECKVCGRQSDLVGDLCTWCDCFSRLSAKIQTCDCILLSASDRIAPDFSLPAENGMVGFSLLCEKDTAAALHSIGTEYRIYLKKRTSAALHGIQISVCDYAYSNVMDTLSESSEGIRRIAVCRMDVDNLGQAFVSGFEAPSAKSTEEQYRYVTITRTAAFSRQLSNFFGTYMNSLLSGAYGNCAPLAVSVVYSGGDDVFLVGAWDAVINAANRIQSAFSEYTSGALTISGGIGLFDDHFPIRISAMQTAALEDRAKQERNKNAVSLFDPSEKHTYPWTVFREKVLSEKVGLLDAFFKEEDNEHGNALLYRLLELLRQAQKKDGAISIARYAYQLARLEPKAKDPRLASYRTFARAMYDWALDEETRNQLITAIYLHVYKNRSV